MNQFRNRKLVTLGNTMRSTHWLLHFKKIPSMWIVVIKLNSSNFILFLKLKLKHNALMTNICAIYRMMSTHVFNVNAHKRKKRINKTNKIFGIKSNCAGSTTTSVAIYSLQNITHSISNSSLLVMKTNLSFIYSILKKAKHTVYHFREYPLLFCLILSCAKDTRARKYNSVGSTV